ncbi:protein 3a [Barley yellow dwarf virus-kerII]|nr:protein 3a [Barley yellow dwarf virus-kerII]
MDFHFLTGLGIGFILAIPCTLALTYFIYNKVSDTTREVVNEFSRP